MPKTGDRKVGRVHIIDCETGATVLELNAVSAADALAYYLRTRGLAPDATEDSVVAAYFVAAKTRPADMGPPATPKQLSNLAGTIELEVGGRWFIAQPVWRPTDRTPMPPLSTERRISADAQ